MAENKGLLSKTEAAALLGVSPFSMGRLMREIGFIRVGKRRVLFSRQAVEDYIRSRTVPPRARRLEAQP